VRVLLISEGTHEGSPEESKPKALQAIAERILPEWCSFQWLSVRELPRGNPLPGKGGGHLKLAFKAMQYGLDHDFDVLILVTDEDGYPERAEQFDEAQQSTRFTIPRALGIPVGSFDAWILADQQALSRVLIANVPTQPTPEEIRDPKTLCRELMKEHGWQGTQAEFYEAVCRALNLDSVAERCPRGFAPFLERLRLLNRECGGADS
jgi:hypothetical protein